jgi:hypothetical protein
MAEWTDKKNTSHLKVLFDFLKDQNHQPAVAPRWKFAAGIVESHLIVEFLKVKNFKLSKSSLAKLLEHKETAIIPVALHKDNKGVLQFNKDPYSGNTAAFSELFGYDSYGNSIRNILVFCVSTSPAGFDIHSKYETDLYQTIARYADILILDNKDIIERFKPSSIEYITYEISAISEVTRLQRTEDMGLISTFLQMGVIGSDWDVCMIAVHHASWQQIRIRDNKNFLDTYKIQSKESKLDLVMQSKDNIFFAAEGKKKFSDFFSVKEQEKISAAFQNVRTTIDNLYKSDNTVKVMSFICLLEAPEINTEIFLRAERQKIQDTIELGSFEKIAKGESVVIGVYSLKNKTHFELFFSKDFEPILRERLTDVFSK